MNILSWAIGALAEAPINVLYNVVESLFRQSPRKTEFNSDFLTPKDIASRYNHGFSITGNRFLTAQESTRHLLCVSPSGGGKSTCIAIPSCLNIMRHGGSIICHDPSGEMLIRLGGYAYKLGYVLLLLDFANAEASDGWNPLLRAHSMSDYMKICTALVRSSLGKSSGDSAFWNNSAITFLAIIVALVKTREPQYHTFANVKFLIEQYLIDSSVIDTLIAKSGNPELVREYKVFIKMDARVLVNIIATCRAAVSLWLDNHIRVMTSFDSIDFDSFRKEKTILFIRTNTASMHYYSVLTSLFLEQMFGSLMSRLPDKKDKYVYFILDEASSLYLPDTLQIALSNLRKYNGSLMLLIQDYNQLKHLYENAQAEAIRSNCYTKIYMQGMPIDVCRELEQLLGKFEYQGKDGRKGVRQLLTADEIATLPDLHSLVMITGKRACYAPMHPFYDSFIYNRGTSLPVPSFASKVPFTEVPLLK